MQQQANTCTEPPAFWMNNRPTPCSTGPPPAGPGLVQRRRRAPPLVQVLLNALHRQQRGLALPQRSRHGLRWGTGWDAWWAQD